MVIGTVFLLSGLLVGSFLNVCIDRLPRGGSIVAPASRCDACGHKLGLLDLIPLLSYLFLRGRCRYCKARIPLRVPLVELATGLLFALLWHHYGGSLELVAGLVFTGVFITILAIDMEHSLIPNRVVYPAIVVAILLAFVVQRDHLLCVLLGGVAGGGLLLLIALVFPRGMGLGDVKYAGLIGLVVGFPQVFVGLTISFVLGGLAAALLLLWRREKVWGQHIPFGPFLSAGALVTMLYGQEITRWYLGAG